MQLDKFYEHNFGVPYKSTERFNVTWFTIISFLNSLQRERILQQNKEMEEKQSAFRAEERQKAEQARKIKIEKDQMRIEDYLSGLAPKTTAPAVTLQAAYLGKVCVGWPKVSRNSRGNPVNDIVYRLFARGRIINVGNTNIVPTENAYKVRK